MKRDSSLDRFDHASRLRKFATGCNPIFPAIVAVTIVIDDYILEVLMRDLVGHDRSPSAYLVYLHLWSRTVGSRQKTARLSHQMIADSTGLSKSAVQGGMRNLVRRRLVSVQRVSVTAVPVYRLSRPWLNR